MELIFRDIEPWAQGEPFVEIRSNDELIDLHNLASFLGFEFRLPETLVLSFDYDETWGGTRDGIAQRRLHLRFDGVSDLEVAHAAGDFTYEGETLSDIVYVATSPGRGSVEVIFMDRSTLRFKAGSVALE